jgi:hypothetical protein
MLGAMAATPLLSSPLLAATTPSKVSRVMVQGRPQDTGSPYQFGAIMTALDKLGGVRKMRCREPYSGTAGWKVLVALAQKGVKFSFTLSAKRPVATSISDLRLFLQTVPGSIFAIEGPNEPDLNPVTYNGVTDPRLGYRTGNAPALIAYMKAFTAALSVDAALRTIPFICSNDYMQAQQAPYSQLGNSHIYPKATSVIADKLTAFKNTVLAGKHSQGIITEWGRTTGGGSSNFTAPPVSLSQQATLLASDVRAALASPYVHTISIFELFAWGGTSEINNFGIFNADGSARPAAAAIKTVLTT